MDEVISKGGEKYYIVEWESTGKFDIYDDVGGVVESDFDTFEDALVYFKDTFGTMEE